MKRVGGAVAVLLLIVGMISVHIYKTISISSEIVRISDKVYGEYYNKNWREIENELEEISDIWYKNRLWACSTLSTKQIEEIEVSLEQSLIYAKVEAEENFIGEFRMFCMLIEHLPKQEGASVYELL